MVSAIALVQFFIGQAASLPASVPTSEIPVGDALSQLIAVIGGLKGATALGIAIAVTQAIMLFFRTPLAAFAGKWKFLIVVSLASVTTYLGLVASGVNWGVALTSAPFVAAIQVLFNQGVKMFKPETPSGEEK